MDINTPSGAASREHLKALDTLGTARTFFIALALLCLATHVGAWVSVQFFDVLGAPAAAARSAKADAAQEPPAPAAASATPPEVEWRETTISVAMSLAELVGRCAIILLCVTMLLAVLVNVSGRMGGVSDFVVAFYLAIVVAALFVPWDRLIPHESGLPGVFTTLDQIEQHNAHLRTVALDATVPRWANSIGVKRHDYDTVWDGLRFAGLPFVALLFLMATGRRFTRGHRMAARSGAQEIPMKVV